MSSASTAEAYTSGGAVMSRDAPDPAPRLPVERDGARIYVLRGREALTAYVAGPRGPVFMTLIEKTFGKDVATRTLDTVTRLARR